MRTPCPHSAASLGSDDASHVLTPRRGSRQSRPTSGAANLCGTTRVDFSLASLPANYRLLIAAHYLQGVQYEDLADALQLPLGTVKTQLYRAKQQLRRMLETDLK